MTSLYPTSLDTFAEKRDDVDYIMAAHINALQDAIAALQAELGLQPSGPSWETVAARLNSLQTLLLPPPVIFTVDGDLVVGDLPFYLYNESTKDRLIDKVFLNVGGVDDKPSGADIVVDVKHVGISGTTVSIFGEHLYDMPYILATDNTGYILLEVPVLWDPHTAIMCSIMQVGSVAPGKNLVISIYYHNGE